MYEELVRSLRICATDGDCSCCLFHADDGGECAGIFALAHDAADAIEELSAHYCPHAIRNVHDRGDDSLCRVLMAEVPKGE